MGASDESVKSGTKVLASGERAKEGDVVKN